MQNLLKKKLKNLLIKLQGKADIDVLKNIGKQAANEIAIAGGLVTGGGFTSANYIDFYGLHEDETNEATEEDLKNSKEKLELEKQISAEKEKQASLEEVKMA